MSKLGRILRHFFTLPSRAKEMFPDSVMAEIEAAIAESEKSHSGEICFVVESCLTIEHVLAGMTARKRAEAVFLEEGLWNTEHNNGVLIYLLLADHEIEIVADRGIDRHVGAEAWERICRKLEQDLKENTVSGVREAVGLIGELLVKHFPDRGEGKDEVENRPRVR